MVRNFKTYFLLTIAPIIVGLIAFGIISWAKVETAGSYIDDIVQMEPSDPDAQIALKKLVAMGPDAISPIIDKIRNNGPWNARIWQLNIALEQLGQPARQHLISTIGNESNSLKKIRCIYALQRSFKDFSCTHLWLHALSKNNADIKYTARYLRLQLIEKLGEDVPFIFVDNDNEINPTFVKWYQRKATPNNSLPVWKP